jgi:hypothetical protein
MSIVLQPADISRFRTLVARRMGLLFEDDKLDFLAEVLRERLEANASSWDVQIRGIDIDPQMIDKATSARYSAWSLRETPSEMRERYFRPQGRDFQLEERVRSAVSFEERNLLDATSVVFGMPREAILLGAAERVIPLEEFALEITALASDAPPGRRT